MRPSLLHYPALQSFSPNLVVHFELRCDDGIQVGMSNEHLAERTLDALKSKPATAAVTFSNHGLRTMLMQNMPAVEADRRCTIKWLRPTDRAPFVTIRKFRQRQSLRCKGSAVSARRA